MVSVRSIPPVCYMATALGLACLFDPSGHRFDRPREPVRLAERGVKSGRPTKGSDAKPPCPAMSRSSSAPRVHPVSWGGAVGTCSRCSWPACSGETQAPSHTKRPRPRANCLSGSRRSGSAGFCCSPSTLGLQPDSCERDRRCCCVQPASGSWAMRRCTTYRCRWSALPWGMLLLSGLAQCSPPCSSASWSAVLSDAGWATATALSIFGVVLLAAGAESARGTNPLTGVLLGLGAGFGYALYSWAGRG